MCVIFGMVPSLERHCTGTVHNSRTWSVYAQLVGNVVLHDLQSFPYTSTTYYFSTLLCILTLFLRPEKL